MAVVRLEEGRLMAVVRLADGCGESREGRVD